MALPYENATSGSGALDEIRKVLTRFGCSRFGTMTDNELGELLEGAFLGQILLPGTGRTILEAATQPGGLLAIEAA